MASLAVHRADCIEALGEGFDYVHEWLDEFFSVVGPQHRSIRHNNAGVEEVRAKWGDKAAQAARIHIDRDGENFKQSESGLWLPPEKQREEVMPSDA